MSQLTPKQFAGLVNMLQTTGDPAIPPREWAGCWTWTGSHLTTGYAVMGGKGGPRVVHRVVWEMLFGPIPEGLELDHLCRNRGCSCPDHLELVTHAENLRRGRNGPGFKLCPAGHALVGKNAIPNNTGSLICIICRRHRSQKVG